MVGLSPRADPSPDSSSPPGGSSSPDGNSSPDDSSSPDSNFPGLASAAATTTAILAVALYLYGIGIGVTHAGPDQVESGWDHYLVLRLLCCGLAIVLVAAGLLLHRSAHRGPWILLALLIFAWTLRPIRELYIPGPPPWGGYYFLLTVTLQSFCMVGALFWITRLRRAKSDSASRLDVGVLLAGFLAFELHSGVIPGWGLRPELSFVLGFGIVAPLGFAVTLALLARLLFIESISGRAFVLLWTAFAAVVIPQVYSIFFTGDTGDNLALSIAVDTAPLVTLLIAAAALHPSMIEITAPSRQIKPEWSITRCAVLVLASVLPLLAVTTGRRPGWAEGVVLVALSVTCMTFIIWRARSAVDALRKAERESHRQAVTDSLTGLLNRRGAVAHAGTLNGSGFGLAFCDLDGFKRLNDVHGYGTGDDILVAIGTRLRQYAADTDVVTRLGGDEFAVIYTGEDLDHAGELAIRAVREALAVPVPLGDRRINVRASVGLSDTRDVGAMLPSSITTTETSFLKLLRQADIALHIAKGAGGSRALRFSAEMEDRARRELDITETMAGAIDLGLVSVHYQAVMNMATDRVAGAEALMRLRSPALGVVSPAEFIPLAERNGQILELGGWILTAALNELGGLGDRLPEGFRLSINVSPLQLGSDVFVEKLRVLAVENHILVPHLRLEITESALADTHARAALDQIAETGIQLALDDFGADYASLQYLTSLPVQVLKLDRSFVGRLDAHHADRAVVRHVLALARDLDIEVVAEGVETRDQARFLADLGCPYAQGFLWDRPAPSLARFGLN